jgi:hypothetical protein
MEKCFNNLFLLFNVETGKMENDGLGNFPISRIISAFVK